MLDWIFSWLGKSEGVRSGGKASTKDAMENVAMGEILAESDSPKQRFLPESLVEVRMLEKGLRGSWHPAKVLEVHKGKRLVEYDELLDDDEKGRLKEFVPVGRASDGDNLMGTLPLKSPPKKSRPVLRPRPPAHPDSQPISWQEGVWVDCYYEDAWWEGVLAENITTIVDGDISMVTRKSEVEVLFPEENDISKVNVNQLRIGQDWDEETGNWCLKGCVPVPVARPVKKRSNAKKEPISSEKKESSHSDNKEVAAPALSKAAEAAMASLSPEKIGSHEAIESELCDNPLALNTLIRDLCQNVANDVKEASSADFVSEGRLVATAIAAGGGSPSTSLNVGAQEPANGSQPEEEPPLPPEKEAENNTPAEPQSSKKAETQTPKADNESAAQNEEAAQTVLTHAGWKVTRLVRRKTGAVTWICKSPKGPGTPVKTFSTLLDALGHEAQRGAPGGKTQEAKSLSQSNLADMKDCVMDSSAGIAGGEDEVEKHEYAANARKILSNAGWEVFGGLRTGSDGQNAWVYRSPGTGTQTRKWFKNWRLALDEYVKQETDSPSQKKRGGRAEIVSPVPSKRVTRRVTSPESATKPVDNSGPPFIKADEVPKSLLLTFTGFGSDLDDEEKKEIGIVMDSVRKSGVVGKQRMTRSSNGASSVGSADQEKPFGSIVSMTERADEYTLQVNVHNFLREQLSVSVERGDMVIKAKYVVEEQFNNIPVRYSGSSSARMALPKNAERQKITAKLESPLLTFTLPKVVLGPNDSPEIEIS